MDVLTEILASLRLNGGIVFDAEMHGEWCAVSQYSPEHCAPYFAVPEQVISYHYVRRGHLNVELMDGTRVHAGAGTMVLFPRNDVHLIYSRPGLAPRDLAEVTSRAGDGRPSVIRVDGEGEETALFCGWLGVSSGNHPLLEALPPVMLFAHDDENVEWLNSSLSYAAGGLQYDPTLVAKLSEVFFARAVRHYVEELGPDAGGWLKALREPAVAKALALIHARYADNLDIEEIARAAGVSRTVLGERFSDLIGEPPMRYCAKWRMRVAANMLRDGKHNSANIAYSVGFNSEAAFNRAFKREYGEPPATWKRRVDAEARAAAAARLPSTVPEQEVRYCEANDGTRLAFSVVGEGRPLVKTANWLTHIAYDWESPVWRHWMRELVSDRSLVRYDERANGLSDWDTPEISFDAFVADLECVVDCAELEQFDLLGISQGAAVAIAYAVRHPERVRRLVLYGGYAMGWGVRAQPEEIAKREAMITLTSIGWGADNPAYRQLFTNLFIPGGTAQQQDWFNELQRRSTSPENAVTLQRVLSMIDVRDLLPKVRAPTLVCHVRDDQVVPFGAGRYLAEHIPGATFLPIEGQNHILLEQEPTWAGFINAVRRFLEEEPCASAISAKRPEAAA